MIISARNQLAGKIEKIEKGAVNAAVVLRTVGGDKVTATISIAAVEELGLTPGKEAVAVIKATEVMIGIGEMKISARNQLAGEILKVEYGSVSAIVSMEIAGGLKITATISMEAAKELGLTPGMKVKAVIKATSVMIAI